jgi:hypothetical protein
VRRQCESCCSVVGLQVLDEAEWARWLSNVNFLLDLNTNVDWFS